MPVRLEELGSVIDGVETDKVAAWFNGVRGVILAIQRQPGTNTVEVVDNIKQLLPVFRSRNPADGQPGHRLRRLPNPSAAPSTTSSSRSF